MEPQNFIKPNKGGRPSKAVKRDQIVAIKCTRVEKEAIEERAKTLQVTVSEYLREIALFGKINTKNKALPKEILLLGSALNHAAANLNQIARRCNMDLDFNAAERSEIKIRIKELKDLVTVIKDSFR